MNSPKTTWAGAVLAIASALAAANVDPTVTKVAAMIAAAAGGLLGYFAKDHTPPTGPAPVTALLLSLALFGATGCATLQPGADPVVVRAEQTEQVAFATFDTFVHLVADHEADVQAKVPAAFTFAEWLRAKEADGTPRGLALVNSLSTVRRAYASHRTPENQASLSSRRPRRVASERGRSAEASFRLEPETLNLKP